jgi:lysyl-tRNA synthetase class 2
MLRDDISTDEEKTMYNVVFKKLLDIGDFIGVRGTVFRTQVGEISVHIYGLTVLAKQTASCCKTDADGKTYDAFADAEQRYRRRYVDLTVNDHVKETFIKRTKCSTPCVLSLTTEAILEVEHL